MSKQEVKPESFESPIVSGEPTFFANLVSRTIESGSSEGPLIDPLNNTIASSKNGEPLLVQPDGEAVDRVQRDSSGRVEYFPTPSLGGDIDVDRVREPEYAKLIMDPLIRRIREEFGDKTIAMRAVGTSINGDLPATGGEEGLDLKDVTALVETGIEKHGEVFNVAVLSTQPEDASISVHRVNQYACQIGLKKIMHAAEHQKEALFPAVIVYDAMKLKHAMDGSTYGASFRDGINPREAVLKVYLLDCPVL